MMNTNPQIPGADLLQPNKVKHPHSALATTWDQWNSVFYDSLNKIQQFTAARNPYAFLARCASLSIVNEAYKHSNTEWYTKDYGLYRLLGQPDVEFLQALILTRSSTAKLIPTSPSNMERLFELVTKCNYAFLRKNKPKYPNEPEIDDLIQKIRLQTILYRNLFSQKDCETVVNGILRQIDDRSLKEIGFALSEMYSVLIAISSKISERFLYFHDQTERARNVSSKEDALSLIEFFCGISPLANRAWSICRKRCNSLENLRSASFQLSELTHDWIYTLDIEELRKEFGTTALSFLNLISLSPSSLNGSKAEHYFMDNPVWSRPFIRIDDTKLFLPIPGIIYSFPFLIVEYVISEHQPIKIEYEKARSNYLEETIQSQIQVSMPSAELYKSVVWRDEETGKDYENDVVALVGNTIFLFEAKSGRLDEVARRGGEKSLRQNFRNLFVKPGEQARRLEIYLNAKGVDAELRVKGSNQIINLDLTTPKIVHKFSICMEHFAALTSAKHYLEVFDVLRDENAWAPVLSLGELMMICRHLDTEISFFHYLTRRATLEEVVDFEGDEQDILSLYLTNGLCLNQEGLTGHKLYFLGFDSKSREEKNPRRDRTRFELLGISLPDYWRRVSKEIYDDVSFRHRFDILQVILNQEPKSLYGVIRQAKEWKKGRGRTKGDVIVLKKEIGSRTFLLAYHFSMMPFTEHEWKERAREIAVNLGASEFGATDCVVLLRIKSSRERTFDAVSFFRLNG